jgi:hypothetical protein
MRCWESVTKVEFEAACSRCLICGDGRGLALRLLLLLLRCFRLLHGELHPDELLLDLEIRLRFSVSWLEVREPFRTLVGGFGGGRSRGWFRSHPRQVKLAEKGDWPGARGLRMWPRLALEALAHRMRLHRPLPRTARTQAE